MPGKSNKLKRFWSELKHRKVIPMNMVYAASGFVILELFSVIGTILVEDKWVVEK